MLASESRARGAQRTAALRSRRNQLLVPIEVPLKPGHVKSRASGEVGRRKRGTSAAEHGCHDLAKGAEVDALALRLVRFRHQLLHVHRRNVDSELGLRVPALSNRILRLASRPCTLSLTCDAAVYLRPRPRPQPSLSNNAPSRSKSMETW